MSVIHNERVKLTATWLNTLASATATAGVLAPLASIIYGLVHYIQAWLPSCPRWRFGFFAALALHLGARRMLRGLKQ
jgi:hypothetical protein